MACRSFEIRNVLVVANPVAGRGKSAQRARTLVRKMKGRGIKHELFFTTGPGEAAKAAESSPGVFDAVVVVGGDGTVSEVAQGLTRARTEKPGSESAALPPMGIVSCGTANCAAKELSIPQELDAALDVIAAGYAQELDVGIFRNGEGTEKSFFLWLGAGLDGAVVQALARVRRGPIGLFHYVRPIVRSVRHYSFTPIAVVVDGKTLPAGATQVIVANMGCYAGFLNIAPQADPSDGRMEVIAFYPTRRLQWLSLAAAAWRGRLAGHKTVCALRGNTVELHSSAPVPIQSDGDPAGTLPIQIRVEASRLRLLVPAQENAKNP
jgi:YegS/Rv2252/BmrU family lipid kinase